MRGAIAVLALLCSTASEATLIEVDLFTAGDGLVTRDTATNLDWLDVTETTGLSFAAVAGGAGGFSAAGWRHASTAEICGLFAGGGAAPSPCPGSGFAANGNAGQLYLDLLGVTFGYLDTDLSVLSFWGLFADAGNPALVGEVELAVDRFSSGLVRTYTGVREDRVSPTSAAGEYGNLLVRAAPVPEPGTGLLLALGVGALAFRRASRGCRRGPRG